MEDRFQLDTLMEDRFQLDTLLMEDRFQLGRYTPNGRQVSVRQTPYPFMHKLNKTVQEYTGLSQMT